MMKFKKILTAVLVMAIVLSPVCGISVSAATYPESSHNYSNNYDYTWTYYHSSSSVGSLRITFSSQTYVEANWDYIYIYTLSGALVGEYTGNELASETITVQGNGFKIRLVSDSSNTGYGFRITSITGTSKINLSGCSITLSGSNYTYSPEGVCPSVTVRHNGSLLYEDVDYEVAYSNNMSAGTGTISITGIGSYTGTATKTFTIGKADASDLQIEPIAAQVYTGRAITPAVQVSLDGVALPSSAYTATYSNNVSAGVATVTISGSNFFGSQSADFLILSSPLPESSHPYGNYTNQTWTYEHYLAADYMEITFHESTRVENGYDWIYVYTLDGELVGEYTYDQLSGRTIAIPGNGFKIQLTSDSSGTGYGFSLTNVVGKFLVPISGSTITLSETDYTYSGTAKTPNVTVTYDGMQLVENTDYTVAYKNNVNAGTATVTITGKGGFGGTVERTFTIQKADSSLLTVAGIEDQYYCGQAITPPVTVYLDTVVLPEDSYTVTYANNTAVGTANVTISSENFSGTLELSFAILPSAIPESEHNYTNRMDQTWTYYYGTTADYLDIKFNSSTSTEANYDYIYIYTLSGTQVGKYCGTALSGKTIRVTGAGFKIRLTSDGSGVRYGFKIDKVTGGSYVNMSKCQITLSKTSYTYTGTAYKPTPTVKYGTKTLSKDTDYTVSYSNNTNAGTGKVTITGKGGYTGKVTKTFIISKLSLSKATISSISAKTYTGSTIKPSVTVKYGGKTISSSNYTVSYKNNKAVGTATVTIKAKGSNVTSSKKTTFKINPKISITKKNLYKGKSFTLKLNGVSVSKVKFSSSKKSVCTVSSKGVVKGVKAGSATITAKYGGKSYKCKVTVLSTASTSSSSIKYYQNHDDVPDFGALLKITPTSSSDGSIFVYSLSDLQNVDPDKEAGSKYKKLLVKCKFENKGTVKKSGKSYYKYVSKKKIVYFGIASKNGEVKIIIEKK